MFNTDGSAKFKIESYFDNEGDLTREAWISASASDHSPKSDATAMYYANIMANSNITAYSLYLIYKEG